MHLCIRCWQKILWRCTDYVKLTWNYDEQWICRYFKWKLYSTIIDTNCRDEISMRFNFYELNYILSNFLQPSTTTRAQLLLARCSLHDIHWSIGCSGSLFLTNLSIRRKSLFRWPEWHCCWSWFFEVSGWTGKDFRRVVWSSCIQRQLESDWETA